MSFIKETYNKFTTGVQKHFHTANIIVQFFVGIDVFVSYILYGVSVSDYFQYRFYKKRHCEKKTFLTCRKHKKICSKYNDPEESNKIKDKILFNKIYKDHIKRDWLSTQECTLEQFKTFCENKKCFIFKPRAEGQGRGVEKYEIKDDENLENLYLQLKAKDLLIEELIIQKKELSEFNPYTVNTIRVNTFRSDDKTYIMSAAIRFGIGDRIITDNISTGGLSANIDIKSGVIFTPGVDKDLNSYLYHPTSNKKIIGYEIPVWNKVKDCVVKLSNITPKVRYVGWDVVIKDDNDILIIEGNDRGNHRIQQLASQKGLWQEYKKVIKEIESKKER